MSTRHFKLHFAVMVLLFHEGLLEVGAVPGFHRRVFMRNPDENWKFIPVKNMSTRKSNVQYAREENENFPVVKGQEPEGSESADDIHANVHLQRQGHPPKSDLQESKKYKRSQDENIKENYDEYDYNDEIRLEEQECEEGYFFHIRGLKCVKIVCPRGNIWRNQDTGECIFKHGGNRWRPRIGSSQNNYRRPFHGRTGGGRGLRVILFG